MFYFLPWALKSSQTFRVGILTWKGIPVRIQKSELEKYELRGPLKRTIIKLPFAWNAALVQYKEYKQSVATVTVETKRTQSHVTISACDHHGNADFKAFYTV